jgi:hypothetical protein
MSETKEALKPLKKLPMSDATYTEIKARAHARNMTPANYVSSLISLADETPRLLHYYVTVCPCCKNDIAIPQYRAKPITMEELAKYTRSELKAARRDKYPKLKGECEAEKKARA